MYGLPRNNRIAVLLIGAVVVMTVCVLGTSAVIGSLGQWAVAGLTVALVGVGASTSMARWRVHSQAAATPVRKHRVLLLGTGPTADYLARMAEAEGNEVIGFVEYLDRASDMGWDSHSGLPGMVHDLHVDRVLVAEGGAISCELVSEIDQDENPVEIYVVPSPYELALGRLTWLRMGDVALLRLSRGRGRRAQRIAKRVFDVAVSLLILAIFGPVLLLAILAIRLTSPGPAIFKQERVGKGGALFTVYKLRTMVIDAEKDGAKLCEGKRDPRLTGVGSFLRRTHLDELPQLWNVLRGEMSLVGPRPERPVFVEQFVQELPRYNERHRIQPGITGLAQVNGFYHSNPREKLRFDLMYLYHRSVWLDMCILARTLLNVFE